MKDKINEYIEYIVRIKKSSSNTADSYRRDLNHMADLLVESGINSFDRVTYTNINAYILYMEKTGKSPSTIVRNISSMKTFFRFMIAKRYIEMEPTELIEPPRVEKKQTKEASEATIEKLLRQPKGDFPMVLRDRAMLLLLYSTGMKVSEITDIRLSDIKMEMEYVECKNGKNERAIFFGKKTGNALRKYIENGRSILIGAGQCDYLFVNCHGNKLSRQGFWKIIKDYAQKAGIEENITSYTFRSHYNKALKNKEKLKNSM